GRIIDQRFFLSIDREVHEIPDMICRSMEEQLQSTIRVFEHAGCLEGTIRSTLVLADWYEINGRIEKAREQAQRVLGPAQALGYERHISHAQEHVTGETSYRQLMSLLSGPRDMDSTLAAATDTEMDRFAENCLTSTL